VILIRHAEKATPAEENPPLSPAGRARAQALAATLEDSGVTAIVISNLRRTRDTAEPLATARKIVPEIVPVGLGLTSAHVAAVVAAVRRHPGEVVLVVGHSNTIPAIIAALGGPHLAELCETQYDRLFVLAPETGGAHLVRSRYGVASPELGPDCKVPR